MARDDDGNAHEAPPATDAMPAKGGREAGSERRRVRGPRQCPACELGQERDEDHADEGAGAGGLRTDEERKGNEEEERQDPHLRARPS